MKCWNVSHNDGYDKWATLTSSFSFLLSDFSSDLPIWHVMCDWKSVKVITGSSHVVMQRSVLYNCVHVCQNQLEMGAEFHISINKKKEFKSEHIGRSPSLFYT